MSKIDNYIWIGNIHDVNNKKFLEKNAITHVLSSAKEIERPDFPVKAYHQLSITDDKANSRTESLFREGAAVLHRWVDKGHSKVIVHCMGGVSRSVSVVMAYYMTYKGYTYDMAYSVIEKARPAIHIHQLYVPILKRIQHSIQRKTRRAFGTGAKARAINPSRIIIFNPSQTKYLVGKESYFIKNSPHVANDEKKKMEIFFTRKIRNPKESTDPVEVKYFSEKLDDIKGLSKGRITFGDIRYVDIDSKWYSYTYPQYVPEGTPFSFPGGQPKAQNITNTTCALRELYEETGIDLTKEPYSPTKLIDTNTKRNSYKIMYYIANEKEYKAMLSDIARKNRSPQAELHDLQFISVGNSRRI
jgi:hypothetical protein